MISTSSIALQNAVQNEYLPMVLSRIADEVSNHPGTVWLPIISLKREDAARLGFDNAARWQRLLSSRAMDVTEDMKIPYEQFRWYAAFHDDGTHPHVHIVVYGILKEDKPIRIRSLPEGSTIRPVPGWVIHGSIIVGT